MPRTSNQNSLKVLVGRFGSNPDYVSISNGASTTVAKVLEAANIKLGSNEKVWVNGEKALRNTAVKRGDIVCVVSPKEAS